MKLLNIGLAAASHRVSGCGRRINSVVRSIETLEYETMSTLPVWLWLIACPTAR